MFRYFNKWGWILIKVEEILIDKHWNRKFYQIRQGFTKSLINLKQALQELLGDDILSVEKVIGLLEFCGKFCYRLWS